MNFKNVLMVFLLLITFNANAIPTAKITLKVVDEEGNPIEGASAGIGFTVPKSDGWGSKMQGKKDYTDSDGLFTAEGETEPYDVGFSAVKEGYYRSYGSIKKFSEVTGIIGLRKWQPWNPTVELVLKDIKNPIPLYAAKLVGINIPELNKFIGFDLVARDWVVPYGMGTHKDFLFKLDIYSVKSDSEFDAVLTLKFLNSLDGVQEVMAEPENGSILKMPHHAPVSGFQLELIQKYKRDRKKVYSYPFNDKQNYFFRVRTEMDEKGNITSALYGKIHGPVVFDGIGYKDVKNALLNFTYYLNPTPNDTNLEFDPKKNLFNNLTQSEEVKRP